MPTSITSLLAVWLAETADPIVPGSDYGVDLTIWKWVVFIGVGAVVVGLIVRRLADVVVKRKTRNIIEQVVGRDAGGADGDWSDLDDLDDPGDSRKRDS